MVIKNVPKRYAKAGRWARRRPRAIVTPLVIGLAALAYNSYIANQTFSVDTATYGPLLELIAAAESSGNYNAYFGNASNRDITFTDMTIAEVMAWQKQYVAEGSASSAVGRYQIIDSTLEGLVKQLGIDVTEKFDEDMQDRLAIALVERRGAGAYVNKQLSRDEFAANLAKEWAALPKVVGDNPDKSYYASDGLNKSRVSIDQIMSVIEPIQPYKT